MRQTTRTSRRVAGYVKRPKHALPKLPSTPNTSAISTLVPALRTLSRAIVHAVPAQSVWRTYGIPLLLLGVVAIGIIYAAINASETHLQAPQTRREAPADDIPRSSSHTPLTSNRRMPTDQSFIDTPYRVSSADSGQPAERQNTSGGKFYSRATGRCDVPAQQAGSIAKLVESCLRRPN